MIKYFFSLWIVLVLVSSHFTQSIRGDEKKAPQSVEELFHGFDPRQEDLHTKLVREWEKDGIVYRYITYHIGIFKGKAARMAAFYGFPKGAKKIPSLLHIHGGGQRAFLSEVEFYAKRGYACLSINWGGREMEQAQKGDENTDWGAVDPTQKNVPGYENMKPGEKYLDPFESPRNNNWFLLTLGCQRGLTFLERQLEVDPNRLGVYGHSMGGSLTIYVAGSDNRVRAASPSVGGSGFRTQVRPFLSAYKPILPDRDEKLFNKTLGFESYSPHIHCPLLWLGATNDFHGVMDDTYRTGALIPHKQVRYSFTPHMNHRFTPEFAVTRPLWFDQYLKNSFTFPKTPESKVVLDSADHVAEIQIYPDWPEKVASVQIYYSLNADPRARFWRSGTPFKLNESSKKNCWTAKLPIFSNNQPIFAFANVSYPIEKTASEPYARPTERFTLSSILQIVSPKELQKARVKATDTRESVIEDFQHQDSKQLWRDWYILSGDNPHHWEYSTRKLNDPKWQGQVNQTLNLEVQTERANELIIVLSENEFRFYRGPQKQFLAVVKLTGGKVPQTIVLSPKDFLSLQGENLKSWQNVDLLSFRAYFEKGNKLFGSKSWVGKQPVFRKLWWQEK